MDYPILGSSDWYSVLFVAPYALVEIVASQRTGARP